MLVVRLAPSKHAYYAGDRVHVRIEFQRAQNQHGPLGAKQAFPRGHRHARKVSVARVPSPDEGGTGERDAGEVTLSTIKETDGHPVEEDDVTITFATVQMTGHVLPSASYIPPEPLLPLRQLLLHQPIGSGNAASSSGGTGAIELAGAVDGTLGASLGGLARGFLGGQETGTWEDRRRRVWLGKELPVWVAGKEVVCVEGRVGGIYTYETTIPPHLPPTFRGKSLAFAYHLELSLTITLPRERTRAPPPPAGGRTWGLFSSRSSRAVAEDQAPRVIQRDLSIPIRVLPRVTVPPSAEPYDLLLPVISRTSDGSVRAVHPDGDRRRQEKLAGDDVEQRLAVFVKGVLDELRAGEDVHKRAAGSGDGLAGGDRGGEESTAGGEGGEKNDGISGDVSSRNGKSSDDGQVPANHPPVPRQRRRLALERLYGSEAIQALIRSSRPGRFEIVKKHHEIAVLSLPKVAWRTGDAVTGMVEFHAPGARFDVLKLSIDLITTETIAPPLLPPPANHSTSLTQPLLRRTVAQYGNAYTLDLASVGFSLGIPIGATAGFQVCVGNAAGETGGLAWGLHVRFLVRMRGRHGSLDRHGAVDGADNIGYRRSGMTGELVKDGQNLTPDLDVDIVECTIPLTVYPSDEGKVDVSEFRV